MKLLNQGRATLRIFDGISDRTQVAYQPAPPHKAIDAVLYELLKTVERTAESYDRVVGEARGNKRLSPEGVKEETRANRQRLADAIAVLRVNAEQTLTHIQQKRAKLFEPPQLDPSDAAGALVDREIRETYNALSEHQRAVELAKPRVRDALLRAPFDSIPQKQAEGLWKAACEAKHADTLNTLDEEHATAQWLLSTAHGYQRGVLDATAKELGDAATTAGDLAERMRAEQQAA